MDDDRKYKQRGYMDSERGPRDRQPFDRPKPSGPRPRRFASRRCERLDPGAAFSGHAHSQHLGNRGGTTCMRRGWGCAWPTPAPATLVAPPAPPIR